MALKIITKDKLKKAPVENVKRLAAWMGYSQEEFNLSWEELLDWLEWQCSIKYKD